LKEEQEKEKIREEKEKEKNEKKNKEETTSSPSLFGKALSALVSSPVQTSATPSSPAGGLMLPPAVRQCLLLDGCLSLFLFWKMFKVVVIYMWGCVPLSR
jgi:hypothetical protein